LNIEFDNGFAFLGKKKKKCCAGKQLPGNIRNIMTRKIKCPALMLLPTTSTENTGLPFGLLTAWPWASRLAHCLSFLPSAFRLVTVASFSCEEPVNSGQYMQKLIEIFGSRLLSLLLPVA